MFVAFLVAAALFNVALIGFLARQWGHMGKADRLILAGLAFSLFPVCWGAAVVVRGVHQMEQVTFCESCHIMKPYAAGLNSDDPYSIPAIHYQNNWVPQKTACYDCHTEYSMFGDVKSKLNGLKHVWVNYTNPPEGDLALYKPYSNRDCLRCHGTSKKFLESEMHEDELEAVQTGESSCIEGGCHDVGHVLAKED